MHIDPKIQFLIHSTVLNIVSAALIEVKEQCTIMGFMSSSLLLYIGDGACQQLEGNTGGQNCAWGWGTH